MYNANEIKTGLIGLIGWRQNGDSAGTQLTGLMTSESGLYFNDVHPLLTFDNLESIAPDYDGFDITSWLQEKTEAGIIGAVEDWIRKKFEVRTAKGLIESERLFGTGGSPGNVDVNKGLLVGLELIPPMGRGVKTKIERLGLQFTDAQTITIRLFKNGVPEYQNSVTVTYASANALHWEAVDWEMDNKEIYYLVYEQSSVTGQSVNGTQQHTAVGYYRAGIGYAPYFPVGKYLKATPFNNTGSFGSIDPADNTYHSMTNYGLNVEFSARCDYTDFIIRHKGILKSLIQKRVGMDLLREMAYNPNTRVNRHESNASLEQILYEIDGDSQGKAGGLKYQYDMELEATSMDQSAIDPVCVPCRKRAVKYRTV